jgi:hypothetical protein
MTCMRLMIAMVMVAIIFSCGINPASSADQALTGTWNWTKSVGGNIGYMDPERCECSQHYVFKQNGRFEFYFDDELFNSGDYYITYEYRQEWGEEVLMLYLGDDDGVRIDLSPYNMVFLTNRACLACPDSIFFVRR